MPRSEVRQLLSSLTPFAVGMAALALARLGLGYGFGGSLVWGIIAAALVAGVQVRRQRQRLRRVERFARAVGRGNFGTALEASGGVLGDVEVALSDMQARVRASVQKLEEAGERTQGILRAMIEGVVVLSSSGEVRLMNECAVTLFDLPSDVDHRGRHLIELCRDPALQELVRETLDGTSGAAVREISLRGADVRHLSVSAARVGDPYSAPFGYVLVFHDITELKRLETMRRDFVANVSHELRTPLTAIRGYAETLAGGALDDPGRARQFLAVIDRHSERLTRLIDDLLVLSDLELGRTPLLREDVPVDGLVADVMEVLSEKARRRGVELRADLPGGLPPLSGDPDRLQQLLINLVDNGVKYTGAGGRVTIAALASGNGASPTLDLIVRDTGIGIPATDLPRLTERFYRVDKARSRELGGTGLGLAIVKHIVQAHGGSMDVSSIVNEGTTVRLQLPVSAAAPPA